MSDITKNAIFAREVERKVDELIAWIVANSPDQKAAVSNKDFAKIREQFCILAGGDSYIAQHVPEPSEGGPQYINDNPAPWP